MHAIIPLSLRLPADLAEPLRAAAKARGVSVNALVVDLIRSGIQDPTPMAPPVMVVAKEPLPAVRKVVDPFDPHPPQVVMVEPANPRNGPVQSGPNQDAISKLLRK